MKSPEDSEYANAYKDMYCDLEGKFHITVFFQRCCCSKPRYVIGDPTKCYDGPEYNNDVICQRQQPCPGGESSSAVLVGSVVDVDDEEQPRASDDSIHKWIHDHLQFLASEIHDDTTNGVITVTL